MSAALRLLTPAEAKRFTGLQASAALDGGFAVTLIEDDRGMPAFIVSRWAMTRQLDDLNGLADFLQRVGVQA